MRRTYGTVNRCSRCCYLPCYFIQPVGYLATAVHGPVTFSVFPSFDISRPPQSQASKTSTNPKNLPKRIFFLKHAPRSVHDVAVHDVGDVRGPVRYRPYRVRAGAVGVGADGLRQYAEPR
jgi:hypothetical protein